MSGDDRRGAPDPYREARKWLGILCFGLVSALVLASIVNPAFHVDTIVLGMLIAAGGGLLAVSLPGVRGDK